MPSLTFPGERGIRTYSSVFQDARFCEENRDFVALIAASSQDNSRIRDPESAPLEMAKETFC